MAVDDFVDTKVLVSYSASAAFWQNWMVLALIRAPNEDAVLSVSKSLLMLMLLLLLLQLLVVLLLLLLVVPLQEVVAGGVGVVLEELVADGWVAQMSPMSPMPTTSPVANCSCWQSWTFPALLRVVTEDWLLSERRSELLLLLLLLLELFESWKPRPGLWLGLQLLLQGRAIASAASTSSRND